MYVGQRSIPTADASRTVSTAYTRRLLASGGNHVLLDSLGIRTTDMYLNRPMTRTIGDDSLIFYAKSTRTLIAGLRAVPNDPKLTCKAGNLAVFLGKYNAEKEVASHYANVIGGYAKSESKNFGKFAQGMERQRLAKRAAYAVISLANAFEGAHGTIGLLDDSVTLAALAGFLQVMRHGDSMDMMEQTGLFED